MRPKVLSQFPQCAGKKFRPSNGTAGMIFEEAFCENCIHEKWIHTQKEEDKKCETLSATMIYDEHDEKYPKEWIYDQEGWPVCTKWQKWDWGFDDESGSWNDPPAPEPVDPNQLCLPFEIMSIMENVKEKQELHATGID